MKNKKNYDIRVDDVIIFIRNGEERKIKHLFEQGVDIHYEQDYFLYLAAFAKNQTLQKYFIDLGLDPEVTKGRLEYGHPDELEFLREYKKQKEIKDEANKLNTVLSNEDNAKTKKIKI
jgi:hypothetical protein